MNYPHRAAGYRKGKIFIASWGGELNLLSAFGGLKNNSHRCNLWNYFMYGSTLEELNYSKYFSLKWVKPGNRQTSI